MPWLPPRLALTPCVLSFAVALVQEAPVLLLLPLGLPRSLLPVTLPRVALVLTLTLPRVVALVHSAPVTVDS